MSRFFSSSGKPVRDECSNFLRKQNHSKHNNKRRLQQHISNQAASDGALFGAMLLPESQTNQCNG
jgi:hypothetical protein